MLAKITILNMGELDPLIEDIQWLFDEAISVEALVGDYLGAYLELHGAIAGSEKDDLLNVIIEFVLDDYDSAGLFMNLTAEHKESVRKNIANMFELINAVIVDNEIDLSEDPPWELIGMRGDTHVILGQAKSDLPIQAE